jgi:hypothetical protein
LEIRSSRPRHQGYKRIVLSFSYWRLNTPPVKRRQQVFRLGSNDPKDNTSLFFRQLRARVCRVCLARDLCQRLAGSIRRIWTVSVNLSHSQPFILTGYEQNFSSHDSLVKNGATLYAHTSCYFVRYRRGRGGRRSTKARLESCKRCLASERVQRLTRVNDRSEGRHSGSHRPRPPG